MHRSKVKTEIRFDFGQHALVAAYPNVSVLPSPPRRGTWQHQRLKVGTFSFSIRSLKKGYRSPRNNSGNTIVPSTASMHSPSGIINVLAIIGGVAEGIAPSANGRTMQTKRHSPGCITTLRSWPANVINHTIQR